jgi:hypothetical protein
MVVMPMLLAVFFAPIENRFEYGEGLKCHFVTWSQNHLLVSS